MHNQHIMLDHQHHWWVQMAEHNDQFKKQLAEQERTFEATVKSVSEFDHFNDALGGCFVYLFALCADFELIVGIFDFLLLECQFCFVLRLGFECFCLRMN